MPHPGILSPSSSPSPLPPSLLLSLSYSSSVSVCMHTNVPFVNHVEKLEVNVRCLP